MYATLCTLRAWLNEDLCARDVLHANIHTFLNAEVCVKAASKSAEPGSVSLIYWEARRAAEVDRPSSCKTPADQSTPYGTKAPLLNVPPEIHHLLFFSILEAYELLLGSKIRSLFGAVKPVANLQPQRPRPAQTIRLRRSRIVAHA